MIVVLAAPTQGGISSWVGSCRTADRAYPSCLRSAIADGAAKQIAPSQGPAKSQRRSASRDRLEWSVGSSGVVT